MTERHEDNLDALIDRARGPESWDERFVRQGGTGRPAPGQEDVGLLAERRAFYASRPAAAFAHSIESRRRGGRMRAWWAGLRARPIALGAMGTLAAASVAVVVAVGVMGTDSGELTDPGRAVTRTKGTVTGPQATPIRDADVSIDVQVLSGAGTTPLTAGSTCRRDDQLRFRYDSGDLRWLWLGSIDANGNVSAWYPEDGTGSLAIVPGRGVPLPGSVTLDDYVGPERLFAVFSREPLDGSAVKRAAGDSLRTAGSVEMMGRLALDETAQTSLVIRKVAD